MCKLIIWTWFYRIAQGSFYFICLTIFYFSLWYFKENHLDKKAFGTLGQDLVI